MSRLELGLFLPNTSGGTVIGSVPAPANRPQRIAVLPNSNFDAFDNLGPGRGSEREERPRTDGWREDYLETPTYLRKKAN